MGIFKNLKTLLFDSYVTVKNGNDDKVMQELYTKRMNTCTNCPLLLPTGNCSNCGCFVREKAKYVDESCPVNKW